MDKIEYLAIESFVVELFAKMVCIASCYMLSPRQFFASSFVPVFSCDCNVSAVAAAIVVVVARGEPGLVAIAR